MPLYAKSIYVHGNINALTVKIFHWLRHNVPRYISKNSCIFVLRHQRRFIIILAYREVFEHDCDVEGQKITP